MVERKLLLQLVKVLEGLLFILLASVEDSHLPTVLAGHVLHLSSHQISLARGLIEQRSLYLV